MPRLLPMLASCLLLAACKTEPGLPAVCHESIQRGTQLAGVGDAVSARDWLAQGLAVLVQQRTDKTETDVTVFAPRWVGFDPALDQELREAEMQ